MVLTMAGDGAAALALLYNLLARMALRRVAVME